MNNLNTSSIFLKDVFIYGRFGTITLGQHPDEIIAALGKPASVSHHDVDKDYRIKILHYEGWYEFEFHALGKNAVYKLVAMQNDSYQYIGAIEGDFKEKNISFDTWIFQPNLSLEATLGVLHQENISYVIQKEYDTTVVQFSNQAKILFEKDKKANNLLCVGWSFRPK